MMRTGFPLAFGSLWLLSLLVTLGVTVLVVWALIVWIRAGSRWLQLNPRPASPAASRLAPGVAAATTPEAIAAAAWLNTNEAPTELAARLGISGEAASRIHRLALRVALGAASPAELAELAPWLPRLRRPE